jgi:hypothetical protein
MITEIERQEIKDRLSALMGDENYAPLLPLLKNLSKWITAENLEYPAEIFYAFIDLAERMKNESQNGKDIVEILNETISGKFVQPNWDVNDVYQTQGNLFQFVFKNVRDEISKSVTVPILHIPIILLVMTSHEAEELTNGNVLENTLEEFRSDFETLQALLNNNGIDNWKEHYGESPKSWKPFIRTSVTTPPPSIEQLINDSFARITDVECTFVPYFIDIRELNQDRTLLKGLRRDGCIVIIDSISMCHPSLHIEFHNSNLDAYPNTAVISVAPTHPALNLIREMQLIIQMRISDMEFAKRRIDDDEDAGICEELSEENTLKTWLVRRIRKMPEIADSDKKRGRSYMFAHLKK